jgi:hypothetical protein
LIVKGHPDEIEHAFFVGNYFCRMRLYDITLKPGGSPEDIGMVKEEWMPSVPNKRAWPQSMVTQYLLGRKAFVSKVQKRFAEIAKVVDGGNYQNPTS